MDNPHGAVVTVYPERGLNARNEKALEEKLAAYKESLTAEEKQALIAQTKHLHQYQEEPSAEEDLRKIPMLKRSDMKKEAMPFSNTRDCIGEIPVVWHEINTNGIDYVSLMFDVVDIPQEDIPYLGLLRSVLGYVNTASYNYAGLANAIHIYTGGISGSVNAYPNVQKPQEMEVRFELKMKVLHSQFEQAMKLVDEILRTSDVTDTRRLGEIIAQIKARLQVNLSSSGNSVAAMRAMSYESRYAFYQDATTGIAYYRMIQKLDKQMKIKPQAVVEKLQQMMQKIFTRSRLLISFTATEPEYRESATLLETYLGKLSAGEKPKAAAEIVFEKKNEGFTDASQIQYVARAGNFRQHGLDYSGTLKMLKVILNYDYLWTNIRVIGGAYGCGSAFLRTGEGYFASYRDPNLGKTNEVYEKIPDYIRSFDADERDMTKYMIGTFGALDTPLNPEAKGSRSMAAYLEELTYEDIQKERDEILSATPADIRKLAEPVAAILSDDCLCVIGNENGIRTEQELFMNIQGLCD